MRENVPIMRIFFWKYQLLAVLFLAWSGLVRAEMSGVLDEYVKRPDSAYGWSQYHQESSFLAKYYFLRLTSQNWLDESKVDRPLWVHEIKISQARALFCGRQINKSRTAIIVISGGKNHADGHMDKSMPSFAGMAARSFCRLVIELRQVPNQPLKFPDESSIRKEDALIAYSFDRYLRSEPGDWPVQLAMVKSVVQAMTAIQEFSRSRDDIQDIDNFVLLGASKRGWTAWLTAAIDPRVKAIVPVSIDMLDLAQQFPHQFAAYGGYSHALREYQAFDIGRRMATNPRGRPLLGIVDPIAYLDRLQLPKLLLNSTGDEFFVSDSWRFYYDRLKGNNRLRYNVNSDHRQGSKSSRYDLIISARNWINDVLAGREPPSLKWWLDADGSLVVQPSTYSDKVTLWTADNPNARDFRLETVGAIWKSVELQAGPDGLYRAAMPVPAQGWHASMIEASFASNGGHQVYTTGVYVVPDTLPFQAAKPSELATHMPDSGPAQTLNGP